MTTADNSPPFDGGGPPNYMQRYDDTVDALLESRETFNRLARSSPSSADREQARQMALEAQRTLDLLKSEHQLYIDDPNMVRPPPLEILAVAEALAQRLAQLLHHQERTKAIVNSIAEAAEALKKVRATT